METLIFNLDCQKEPSYLLKDQRIAIDKALAEGLAVFNFTKAVGKILTLDIDSTEGQPPPGVFVTTSRSGNRHGFVTCGNLPADKVEDMARMWRSDPVREKISARRYADGDPYSYLTFETQAEAVKLLAWLQTLPPEVSCLVEELLPPVEPSEKAEGLTAFLEATSGRSTSIGAQRCVNPPFGCGKPVTGFIDRLSAKEYAISGLCQACQNLVFNSDPDESEDDDIPY